MTGRPPRDHDAELARAEAALTTLLDRRHRVRQLEGREADLLHRTFSTTPEAYDAWEFESH